MFRKNDSSVSTEFQDDEVIVVKNLSKKFCRNLKRSLYYGILDLLRNLLGIIPRKTELRKDEFWSVEDLTFSARKGETIGIVGHNGAGKTTLLRVIAGIFPPDRGQVMVKGRVGALVSLGAGFQAIMTGRENIFLNGILLGMTRKEIVDKLDYILDFADIGEFIDAPVSTYSSGMRVRLGFAIASQVNPEVMLVDEVLSVGDATFRERCLTWFDEYRSRGGTIIFISHNTSTVERVCDRVLWLDHGKIKMEGSAPEVIEAYEENSLKATIEADQKLYIGNEIDNLPDLGNIHTTELLDRDNVVKTDFAFKEDITIRFHFEIGEVGKKAYFGVQIGTSPKGNNIIYAFSMFLDGVELDESVSKGFVDLRLKQPGLNPGKFFLRAGIAASPFAVYGRKWYAPMQDRLVFIVSSEGARSVYPGASGRQLVVSPGPAYVDHSWAFEGQELQSKI